MLLRLFQDQRNRDTPRFRMKIDICCKDRWGRTEMLGNVSAAWLNLLCTISASSHLLVPFPLAPLEIKDPEPH